MTSASVGQCLLFPQLSTVLHNESRLQFFFAGKMMAERSFQVWV